MGTPMTLTGKNSQIGFSRLNRSSRLSLLQDALTTMLDVQRGQLTDSAKPTLCTCLHTVDSAAGNKYLAVLRVQVLVQPRNNPLVLDRLLLKYLWYLCLLRVWYHAGGPAFAGLSYRIRGTRPQQHHGLMVGCLWR